MNPSAMRLIRFRSPSISSLHSSAALPSPYIARSARSYHHQRRGQRPRAVAALLPAARHQRLEADARLAADVQRADALGAVALVARDGHQVDVHRVHVQRELRKRGNGEPTLPNIWAQSVWKWTPCLRQMAPISLSGWTTPISLLTPMMETRLVLSVIAFSKSSRLMRPFFCTGR